MQSANIHQLLALHTEIVVEGKMEENGRMVRINSTKNFLFIQNILHNLRNCFFPSLPAPFVL
jgi:hypothetical protein